MDMKFADFTPGAARFCGMPLGTGQSRRRSYSKRRTSIGSMRVARRAGT